MRRLWRPGEPGASGRRTPGRACTDLSRRRVEREEVELFLEQLAVGPTAVARRAARRSA